MEESNLNQNPPVIPTQQPIQPAQNQAVQTSQPTSKSKLPMMLIVIFVSLIIFASGAYYLGLQTKNTNQKNQTSIVPTIAQNSPTPTIDETASPDQIGANWKTYINEEYGFSFKYPSSWIENKDRHDQGDPWEISFVEPVTGIAKKGITIDIYNKAGNFSAQQFLDKIFYSGWENQEGMKLFKETYMKNQSYRSTEVDGISAIQISLIIPAGSVGTGIWFTKNNKGILIKSNPVEGMGEVFQQILATFKFSDNTNVKTYTSTLGISFSYSPKQESNSDWTITVKESGNKICVTYDVNDVDCSKGQYVQVFQKSPSDSLETAIKKQFLSNYAEKDCFVKPQSPYSGFSFPASYETAVISFPQPTDSNSSSWDNAAKCPSSYTAAGGMAYFLEDTIHPAKLLFFSIGQYRIFSENNKSWEQTIKVLN